MSDAHLSRPPYLQLKDDLIAAITTGRFAPGNRLPSQRILCRQYGLSHMTVRRVINELIHEGVIYSVSGKGLYVAECKQPAEIGSLTGFARHMARLGLKPTTRVLKVEIIGASALIARALGIEVNAPIVYLCRLRSADDQPMALSICYLPHTMCPGLLEYDLAQQSLFDILTTHYGWRLVGSVSTIEAKLADAEQAALLNLNLPAALLCKEQLTYVHTGQIVEFSRSYIRADQYHLQVEEGEIAGKQSPSTTYLVQSTQSTE